MSEQTTFNTLLSPSDQYEQPNADSSGALPLDVPHLEVAGFPDLRVLRNPVDIRGIFSTIEPTQGIRVGNRWAEFSLGKDYARPQDPVMLCEPTLGELALGDFGTNLPEAQNLLPSQIVSELPSFHEKLNVVATYLRRLYRIRMLDDPTAPQIEDETHNRVIFGDQMYRVVPTSILGSFSNGKPSPELSVYPASQTTRTIRDNSTKPFFSIYGSSGATGLTPEEVRPAFPTLIESPR